MTKVRSQRSIHKQRLPRGLCAVCTVALLLAALALPAGIAAGQEACPEGSLFSQPAHLPGEPHTAPVSNEGTPDRLLYENFSGLTRHIRDVHWWGTTGHYDVLWTPCERTEEYEITFYADAAGAPGAIESTETGVYPDVEDTGLDYDGYPLYHYSLNIETPVDLAEGWISIQGTTDTD